MVVYSLISAALTLVILTFVAIRVLGHGDVPYFAPHRRVPVAVPSDPLDRPRRRRV
ncbi:MAG: hypothetical protein IPK07_35380 [Deltaproteobacteria bacterium]|nr:hypothetical protein [Deltaproteobacteria bacterium]